jgi:hypothetical protein
MNRERSRAHSPIAQRMVSKQLKSNETQAKAPGQEMVFTSAWRRLVLVRWTPTLS